MRLITVVEQVKDGNDIRSTNQIEMESVIMTENAQ